jgi:hypothetical protein
VQEAAEGDAAAREAVDRCRIAFQNRREEKVAEALSAYEQPANPVELRSLMGMD